MSGFSVNIGANTAPLTQGLQQATAEVLKFNDVIAASAPTTALTTLNNVVSATAHQFDELAASSAALQKIEASINQAAEAATSAGAKFDTLGGRLPLQDFNTFRASIERLKADISGGLTPQIARITPALAPITPAANNAGTALSKIKPGANQAAQALTNVGRVAQDLPFGFIGIQNNLNPLLESFQRLKAETGSSGAALKALGGSLIGAGGIGLALSIASSAVLIFQNGIAGFNSKTKEAKDKAEEFIKTLKSIGQVAGEAAGSQAGDIAQVQALANVVTNTNNAYSQRKRALEELKEVNKNYFGDLKLEESQMGLLTSRVNEYTKALVAQAVLKGFTDEISRVSVELGKQKNVLSEYQKTLDGANATLGKTKQSETSLTGEDRISAKYIKAKSAVKDANKALIDQFNVVGDLRKNFDLLNGEIDGAVKETLRFRDLNNPGKQKAENDGLNKQLELLKKIRDEQTERLGNLFDLKDIDAATDKLAKLEQQIGNLKLQIALRDAQKAKLPPAEIVKLKEAIKANTEKALAELFDKEALLLEGSPKLKFSQPAKVEIGNNVNFFTTNTGGSNFNINDTISKAFGLDKKIPVITLHEVRLKLLGAKLTAQVEAIEKINEQLKDQIRGIFEGGLTDVFSELGKGFGEAIASADFGEGLKKTAQSILGIVGGVMQQLGTALIAAAIKIKLLKETFEKWAIANPALAIVAGIGLVAAGAALKNIRFDGPKFATGGIVTGPVIGQVGEMHRKELIMPLDRLPGMLKSIGGGGGGDFQLIPIINNEGLYLAMKRGERRAGRKF